MNYNMKKLVAKVQANIVCVQRVSLEPLQPVDQARLADETPGSGNFINKATPLGWAVTVSIHLFNASNV